jgi:hypothetical protein
MIYSHYVLTILNRTFTFLRFTHLIISAEALVAPAVLIDDGREPPIMRVILPPHTR